MLAPRGEQEITHPIRMGKIKLLRSGLAVILHIFIFLKQLSISKKWLSGYELKVKLKKVNLA